MATELSTIDEAKRSAQDALRFSPTASGWMVAVWVVENGVLEMTNRTTWQFPTADFPAAVEQLNSVCQKEMASLNPPAIEPLPLAILENAGFGEDEDPFL